MSFTTPDNIFSPDGGNLYSLVDDLKKSADSVQDALIGRANLYLGTSLERGSWSNPPEGVHWQDTDGTKLEYVYISGEWVPVGGRFYSGSSTQRTSFNNAVDGSHWQDTDGVRRKWVRDGGVWREGSPRSGETLVSTGTLTSVSTATPGIYGKTLSISIPVEVDTNTQTVHLTAGTVGTGWGAVSLSGVSANAPSTELSFRFMQFGSSKPQNIYLAWSVVDITD